MEHELGRPYGSVPVAGHSTTFEQLQKSTTTIEFAIGTLAKSRTTTWNVKSPAGHVTMQGSTEEFAGETTGRPALDAECHAAEAQSVAASIRSFMGASSGDEYAPHAPGKDITRRPLRPVASKNFLDRRERTCN